MRIAFLHAPNTFANKLSEQLTRNATGHEFILWNGGDEAPADDLEMLLVSGQVSRHIIDRQAKLGVIQTVTAGYEGIDLEAASEAGIWVANAPANETGNAISVAEFAVFLMLAASRNLIRSLAAVHDRTIELDRINTALFGKTACILGLGHIGTALAERLRPFAMQLVATDEHPERALSGISAYPPDGLAEAVRQADYVIVCMPATKDNENLIDARVLSTMKQGAILINVSRGMLIDESALAAAIASGHIAGAGLDVLKTEPTNPQNPLLQMPQVVVTPHIAGPTDITLAGTVEFILTAIADVTAGRRPQALLNAPKAPRLTLRDR